MVENTTQNQNYPVDGAEVDSDLLDMLIVVAKYKKLLLAAPLVGAVLAGGLSLIIPDSYTGISKIMPPQQAPSSASMLLGQLGGLGGMAGLKNPNDMYLGMLTSRRVSDSLIARFKLQTVYRTQLPSDTRKILGRLSSFASGKDGMIIIEVTSTDPRLAEGLANGYVEELQKLTQILAVTEASQRRLFFENQLKLAKQGLIHAEVELKQFQEKTGVIQLSGQAENTIHAAAGLKAQIASKEVALGAMRTFATVDHPDYIKTQQEVTGLRAQLSKVETGINRGKGDISVSSSKVPEAGLEYIRRVRDVKYYETIFELLAKQFEVAKIDEAKESAVIQVLDSAVEPDRKSGPSRGIIALVAAIVAEFLALCWVLTKEASGKMRNNPDNAVRLERLSRFLKWKSPAPSAPSPHREPS
jgi:tyrosine-protein kinase Etk/Wzc